MTADAAKRGNAVWRHVIGSPREQDVNVFREDNDALQRQPCCRSRSGKFIFIPADGFTSSEWRAIPRRPPPLTPQVIAAAAPECRVRGRARRRVLLHPHQRSGARTSRSCAPPTATPQRSSWQDWVPHRPDSVRRGRRGLQVALRWSSNGAAGCAGCGWSSLQGYASHDVAFPEPAYGVFPDQQRRNSTRDLFRFNYSSLVTPSSVFDYNMAQPAARAEEAQEIPSGFDPSRYEVQRQHGACPRRRAGAGVDPGAEGSARSTVRSPLLLYGVRLIRRDDRADLQRERAQSGGSRLGLRHRTRSWRPGDGASAGTTTAR